MGDQTGRRAGRADSAVRPGRRPACAVDRVLMCGRRAMPPASVCACSSGGVAGVAKHTHTRALAQHTDISLARSATAPRHPVDVYDFDRVSHMNRMRFVCTRGRVFVFICEQTLAVSQGSAGHCNCFMKTDKFELELNKKDITAL